MRACIFGLGRMGLRHIEVLRAVGIEPAGAYDQSEAAISYAMSACGLREQQIYRSPETMLSDLRPELVVVATTTPGHVPLSTLAVQAGAGRVFCEKPLGSSLREMTELVDLCESRGVRLAVNHQMRFMAQYIRPKQMIGDPDWGGLRSVAVTAGNFGLAMNGSHYFEMLRFMADSSVDRVSASLSEEKTPNPRGPQFLDYSGVVQAVTHNGVRYYIDCSSDQGHGVQTTYVCRNGQVVVNELSGELNWDVRKPEYSGEPTTRYGMPSDRGAELLSAADSVSPTRAVLESLLAGGDYPDGQTGLHAAKCVAAAHLSHRRGGTPVRLEDLDEMFETVFPWA